MNLLSLGRSLRPLISPFLLITLGATFLLFMDLAEGPWIYFLSGAISIPVLWLYIRFVGWGMDSHGPVFLPAIHYLAVGMAIPLVALLALHVGIWILVPFLGLAAGAYHLKKKSEKRVSISKVRLLDGGKRGQGN